jgi:hypothetical protein
LLRLFREARITIVEADNSEALPDKGIDEAIGPVGQLRRVTADKKHRGVIRMAVVFVVDLDATSIGDWHGEKGSCLRTRRRLSTSRGLEAGQQIVEQGEEDGLHGLLVASIA